MPATAPVVCDASAALELLLAGRAGQRVAALVEGHERMHAPALFDVEICAAVRSRVARGRLSEPVGERVLADLLDAPVVLWPHAPLLRRCWELRENVSVYDAAYVALAEELQATLVTADRRLARALAGRSPVTVRDVTA